MEEEWKVVLSGTGFEINIEGDQEVVEEGIEAARHDGSWDEAIASLRDVVEKAIENAKTGGGSTARGRALMAFLKDYRVEKRVDQILSAIHILREDDLHSEIPPRMIQQLIEDAGVAAPSNISLYVNRLHEKGYVELPEGEGQRNRWAKVSDAGIQHLKSLR